MLAETRTYATGQSPSAPADVPRVPTAPTYAGETLKVGRDRPLGSPLMCRNASFGFRDLPLQVGYGFLGLAALRAGHLADRKPDGFQALQRVPVPLELNPVPGDVAIAVSNHVAAPATDLWTRDFLNG